MYVLFGPTVSSINLALLYCRISCSYSSVYYNARVVSRRVGGLTLVTHTVSSHVPHSRRTTADVILACDVLRFL